MAAACVLLLLAVAVLFTLYSQNAEQEAAALSVNPSQIALTVSPSSVNIQTGASADAQSDTEISAGALDDAKISVGALDDAEDPQNSGAAGNEGTGAEVTVSKASKDETSTVTLGIDVSKYQGTINWAEVKASGVDFAMIRVGYRAKSTGEIFEDPAARYNMQEAQAAGVKIGAYFFSSAVTKEEAREEAAFTANIIAKYKITYPVAFNCEDFQSPDSRQYGLDATQRTELACAFLDEISAAGYTPMFYASKGELEGSAQWNTDTLAAKYKIWVAQYPEKPYPETASSSYSGSHDMWQYTSQGTVAGIPKKTDVNVAYFGYLQEAEAKDETPAETVTANPEIGIIFTEVNETVTAKQETNLRTEPSTLNDDSIVGKLVHGDTATRTGIGHNGWSRVIYNGQTLYAVTSYLTTDMADTGQQAPPQGPVYTPVNEQVTAKMETNLRTEPSTASDDTIVALLHNGETLTRTAIGDNGWSQLDYNGQTVYAVSSYLIAQ
ncbi:MAG: glycoside hydrolase family 25 [Lachnospiraceae bacterium]|nr:glycoside hydrolase family 25 [Lachnospiraceae bacterium]